MGTHEYQSLARTSGWNNVVALIGTGAGFAGTTGVAPGSLEQIAVATLDASIAGLERAKGDEGLSFSFYLLAQLTQAARTENFLSALSHLGFPAPKASVVVPASGAYATDYDMFDLVAGFTATVDRQLRRTQSRTDIGELAQQAAAESLTALCGPKSDTLFGSSLETVRDSLRGLSTQRGFATLTQDFFARVTRKYLLYHLSRELSNHVGGGRRFQSVDEHNDFLRGVDDHCHVCSKMLRRFAGEWYTKANWKEGISLRKAEGFTAHALDKMCFALRQKGMDDA